MLNGKTALVTGSTSGIGFAIAEALASAQCNVIINGFAEDADAQAMLQQLTTTYGIQCHYSPADLSDPDQIQALVSEANDMFGRVDILVNNAGIQHVSPIESFPLATWNQILAVNLTSAFLCIQHVLPAMREVGWGRIINVSSIHGMVASPYKSAYIAAKHGMIGLTKTVALETAQQGITCNAICPGYVMTPLVKNQIADTAKARGLTEQQVMDDVLLGTQPTKRFTQPEDIAAMALFLCSDSASNMTGSSQVLDGGYTAA